MKRIISFVMAAVMLCLIMTSCADSSPAALTLGEHKITEAQYGYWASSYKGNYMNSYEDVKNTAEYWSSEISEGVTAAEYLDGVTLDSVKSTLVNSMLFDKYRLSFTKDEEASIDAYISDLILERAEGSKNMMNALLGEFGINTKILKKIYLEEEKIAKVYNHLFGEGGEKALKDEDFEKFYKDNFVHVQMIYIENISTYKTDEDGKRITDENGYYVVEKLKGEAKDKKDAALKAAQDKLAAGEDFNKVYEEYSELKDYKNGHYYSATENYGDVFYYFLVAKVTELKVGEVATLESEMGTCIVKKLELDDGAWSNKENEAFFSSFTDTASELAYREFIESYYDDIVVDEAIIKKYSVKDVTPAYYF